MNLHIRDMEPDIEVIYDKKTGYKFVTNSMINNLIKCVDILL